MKLRLPRFDKITDFSAFQNQFNCFCSKQQSGKNLQQNTIETSDNDPIKQKFTRSRKAIHRVPEVSFGKDLMLEHTKAFDFMTQKYLQEMFEDEIGENKALTNEAIFPKKSVPFNHSCHLEIYLKSKDCLLQIKQSQMLMEDLVYEEKLQEFLTYVCSKSCDEVAFQLIFLGNKVWQQYLKIQHEQYSYQKIIEQAKNMAEFITQTLKNSQLIKYITFENSLIESTVPSPKKQEHFKEFIQFLIVTIYLVSSQYFSNPYYELKIRNELKRHTFFNNRNIYESDQGYSEDEDSQQIQSFLKGKKKIK